jgi:hypothetical protein
MTLWWSTCAWIGIPASCSAWTCPRPSACERRCRRSSSWRPGRPVPRRSAIRPGLPRRRAARRTARQRARRRLVARPHRRPADRRRRRQGRHRGMAGRGLLRQLAARRGRIRRRRLPRRLLRGPVRRAQPVPHRKARRPLLAGEHAANRRCTHARGVSLALRRARSRLALLSRPENPPRRRTGSSVPGGFSSRPHVRERAFPDVCVRLGRARPRVRDGQHASTRTRVVGQRARLAVRHGREANGGHGNGLHSGASVRPRGAEHVGVEDPGWREDQGGRAELLAFPAAGDRQGEDDVMSFRSLFPGRG